MDPGGLKVKDLPAVLTATSLIDVCLSKTQRKTPTEIHKRSNIAVIRKFYIRKIKTCAQFFVEKLKAIVTLFPKLDSIHPFYGDLLNILYDRDHYKLALGQVAACINRIERISKEYITLSKYSDSLYKSKSLKTAAFGRCCTAVKKLAKVFEYLEEVRMHLQRLPVIQTSARTLLLAGYPNVGKSSFVNRLSNANVDVQPFAFTTKSLFVGHFDFLYSRWQIIDTPGILDHPLEERNLIEMLAIAALTHLHCVVLFVIDVSEECGYSVEQQVALFRSVQVLFKDKPKLVILNKTDKKSPESLSPEAKALLAELERDAQLQIVATSALTGDGLDKAKAAACEVLLQKRMLLKAAAVAAAKPAEAAAAAAGAAENSQLIANANSTLKNASSLAAAAAAAALGCVGSAAAKLHVSKVQNPRQAFIPESVLRERELKRSGQEMPKRRLARDIEEDEGGPGVYSVDLRDCHILADDSWRYDAVPEFFDGKNVRDFVDPDIEAKLQKLEEEEQALLQKELEQAEEIQDKLKRLKSVRARLALLHRGINCKRMEAKLKKKRNGPRLLKKTKQQLAEAKRVLKEEELAKDQTSRKRTRSPSMAPMKEDDGDEMQPKEKLRKKLRRLTLGRTAQEGKADASEAASIADANIDSPKSSRAEKNAVRKLQLQEARATSSSALGQKRRLGGASVKQAMKVKRAVDKRLFGRAGESDRFIAVKKIKRLNSGKRGIGKTHSR